MCRGIRVRSARKQQYKFAYDQISRINRVITQNVTAVNIAYPNNGVGTTNKQSTSPENCRPGRVSVRPRSPGYALITVLQPSYIRSQIVLVSANRIRTSQSFRFGFTSADKLKCSVYRTRAADRLICTPSPFFSAGTFLSSFSVGRASAKTGAPDYGDAFVRERAEYRKQRRNRLKYRPV